MSLRFKKLPGEADSAHGPAWDLVLGYSSSRGFCHLYQEPKHFIDRFGGWESFCYIGFKQNKVRSLPIAIQVLASYTILEDRAVILGSQLSSHSHTMAPV